MTSKNLDPNELLRSYVERGEARGADLVFEQAHRPVEPATYVQPVMRDRGPRVPVLVAVGLCVLAVFGWFLHARSSGDAASLMASSPVTGSPAPPSEQEQAAAQQRLMEQMRDGWVPYSNRSRISDLNVQGWIPFLGMKPVAEGTATRPEQQALEPRMPVYDKPDGVIIAYEYPNIGPVDVATANSDSFDPRSIRVRLDGCDTVQTDPSKAEEVNACNERLRQQAAQRSQGAG